MSRKWLAVLATAVVLAGGCGEPAGPAEFDAAAMEADLLALVSRDRNLDNVSAGHGLDGAARVMGQFPSGGIILSRGALSHSVREVPDSLRGRTLEWDTETGGYLVSTRIGAPANGTRFLLYEVNAAGGSLVIPLVEAGSLEFRDQSSAERREVRLVAVTHGQVLYDFTGYATGEQYTGTFGVEGFITLSTTRIDVNGDGSVDSENPEGHASSMAVTLTVPSRDFEVQFSSNDPGAPLPSEVGFTNRYDGRGGQLVATGRVELNGGSDIFTEFRFAVNGEDYATRTQNYGNPAIYEGHNGHTVSEDQKDLFDLVSDMSGYPVQVLREMLSALDPFIAPVPR